MLLPVDLFFPRGRGFPPPPLRYRPRSGSFPTFRIAFWSPLTHSDFFLRVFPQSYSFAVFPRPLLFLVFPPSFGRGVSYVWSGLPRLFLAVLFPLQNRFICFRPTPRSFTNLFPHSFCRLLSQWVPFSSDFVLSWFPSPFLLSLSWALLHRGLLGTIFSLFPRFFDRLSLFGRRHLADLPSTAPFCDFFFSPSGVLLSIPCPPSFFHCRVCTEIFPVSLKVCMKLFPLTVF